MPAGVSGQELAESFVEFFLNKIETIQNASITFPYFSHPRGIQQSQDYLLFAEWNSTEWNPVKKSLQSFFKCKLNRVNFYQCGYKASEHFLDRWGFCF